jgi:hypothetical protein
MFETAGMGGRSRELQLREARREYHVAVDAFLQALTTWVGTGVPLMPGPPAEPVEWTRQDVELLLALRDALNALLDRRRHWDALRRETGPH